MKAVISTIAALGVIGSFSGSAIADVSITIRFGSSPVYNSYRSNTYQRSYPNTSYRYNRYHQHTNPSVVVREVYPATNHYGNSWNHTVPQTVILNHGNSGNHTVPQAVIQNTNPYPAVYRNRHNLYQGGYIRQKIR